MANTVLREILNFFENGAPLPEIGSQRPRVIYVNIIKRQDFSEKENIVHVRRDTAFI